MRKCDGKREVDLSLPYDLFLPLSGNLMPGLHISDDLINDLVATQECYFLEFLPFGGLQVRERVKENGILRHVDESLIFGVYHLFRRRVSVNDGPNLCLSEEVSWAGVFKILRSVVWFGRRGVCAYSFPASLKNATFPMCGFQKRVIWSSRSFSLAFCSSRRSRSSCFSFFSSTSFTVMWEACASTSECDGLTPAHDLSGRKKNFVNAVRTGDHDFSFGLLQLDQPLSGVCLKEGGQRFVPRVFDVHRSVSFRKLLRGPMRQNVRLIEDRRGDRESR